MVASKKLLYDASVFFDRVSELTSKIEVSQACNELLERLSEKLTVKTVSSYLTEYKRPFKSFRHELPELNETVVIKTGNHTQHCAVTMLSLNSEQQNILTTKNNETARARDGFDANGEIREVEVPQIDITDIVEISCKCLTSDNPLIIAAGIVNLTGLRSNEQNMPRHNQDDLGIIDHQMVVVSEFVIGFKGVSKKRTEDDTLAFYARPTLAPAQLIVDAQNKYLSFNAVQSISTNKNKYVETFQQQFRDTYTKFFGKVFTTLENFDDDGNLIRENGTPHKGRAFYACALRGILKAKNFGSSAINTYVQLSLAHDSVAETLKYLGRYDESLYVNPVNINIPTNITGLGKMKVAPEIKVNDTVAKGFNLECFIEGLTCENQLEIAEYLNTPGMSQAEAILKLIESITNRSVVSEPEKSTNKKSSVSVSDNVAEKSTNKKSSVSDNVAEIVENIMHYNRQIPVEDIGKLAVPSFGIISRIHEHLYGTTVAPTTIKTYLESRENELNSELRDMGVADGLNDSKHNGKYHRKTMTDLIDRIVVYS